MKKYLVVILCLATISFGINKKYRRPQVNTVGLIGHWKLHEGTAFDYSLRGHSGTLTGTTLTYKYPGIDLPGTDERIVVADHDDFTPALTPFSISAWVYMHDATSFAIASKGVFNTDGEWWFRASGTDKLEMFFFDESVADCYIGRRYSVALTSFQNQWIHLVTTYNGGILSSGIKMYLNGVRVDNANNELNAGSFVSVENLTHDVWIGRFSTVYANGLIDNVTFFNKEISTIDAKNIYELSRWRYQR